MEVKKPPDLTNLPGIPSDDDMDLNDWAGAGSLEAQKQRQKDQETRQKNKQFTNVTYSDMDTGPYRIYFELRKNDGTQRLNKFAIGSTLRKMETYKHSISDMKQVGKNRVLVFISNYKKANDLVDEINNSITSIYKAYVPLHLVTVTGIVDGVPADIPEEEILDDIMSEVPIVSVKRLNRFVDGEKFPTNRISVRFRANTLPDRIRLFCCSSRVRPLGQKLVACGKCLRFNHREDQCKGSRRCKNCAGQHEEAEDFYRCTNKTKCAHCRSEDHSMQDENCPEKIRQRNIKALMSKSAITFAEARECFPLRTQNAYAPLEDLDNYPLLTYASTQQGESLREQWRRTNQDREKIKPAVKTYPDQPKKQGAKRMRKDGGSNADPTNATKTTSERDRILGSEACHSKDGVALNNQQSATEKEKWENVMREARRKAEWTASQTVKTTMMTFYADFLSQLENQEEIKSKFMHCTNKYFNLASSVIEDSKNKK